MLHVFYGFGDVRILQGNGVRLFWQEINPLEIAIVEAALLDFRHDETGIIEVGTRERAFPDPASVEIHMDKFRVFKTAVEDVDVAERAEIHIHAGKIAAVDGGGIEKAESERGSSKHHMGKGGAPEAATYEADTGKIDGHEGNIAKIYVDGLVLGDDRFHERLDRVLGRRIMDVTIGASRIGGSGAS